MYNDAVPLQSTASARQAVRRLQNIGSGADGSTSFFVLAPCVPCLLSEILDVASEDEHKNLRTPQQQNKKNNHVQIIDPQSTASKFKRETSSSKHREKKNIKQLVSQPTWLGALAAVGYELLDEERNNHDHDDDDEEDKFSFLNFIEEHRKKLIVLENTKKTSLECKKSEESKSAEEFWKKRMNDDFENDDEDDDDGEKEGRSDENDLNRDEDEVDEYLAQYEKLQQEEQSPTSANALVGKRRAAPSEFEKHLDEWKRRHVITVPEGTCGGTDALQLRGGKSSVITWAQREMDKYRRLAHVSRIRIQDIKKETDKILARTATTASPNNSHHSPTSATRAGQKRKAAVSGEESGEHGDDEEEEGNGNAHERLHRQNSRVQMLRRAVVASKSVLAMQAQSTAPATALEAALWTHNTPPKGISAILSIMANDDDENVDLQIQKHQNEISMSNSHQQQQKKKNDAKNDDDKKSTRGSGSALPANYKSKSHLEDEALERIITERMELLVGGYSPGVLVSESRQPGIQATSANDRRDERRQAVDDYHVKHGKPKTMSATPGTKLAHASQGRDPNSEEGVNEFKRNTSTIDPHEVKTAQVLVQKTPGERKRILEAHFNNNHNNDNNNSDGEEHRFEDNAPNGFFADTPGVSVIHHDHHHHHHHQEEDNQTKQQPQQQPKPKKAEYSKTKPLAEIARERKRIRDEKDQKAFDQEQQKYNFQPSLAPRDALLGKIKRRIQAPPPLPEHHFFENEWDTTSAKAVFRINKSRQEEIMRNQKENNNNNEGHTNNGNNNSSTASPQNNEKNGNSVTPPPPSRPHPDDLYHWLAIQQLAVLAMQQPKNENAKKNNQRSRNNSAGKKK